MTLILNEPDKIFHFGASPSMVSLWQLCRHKWWLHYVARVGRKEKEAQKDSGIAFHNFLQVHYSTLGEALTFEDHAKLFEQDFPEVESTEKRDQKHLLGILKAYLEHYPRASEPFTPLESEQAIRVEVPGCAIPLNVKLDLLIEKFGGLWVMDHKTSSRLGNTYFEQFRNNWQTYTYIFAASQLLQRKCEGIYYNAIGLKKKIDKDSFMRLDIAKTQAQIDFHMSIWAQVVNEMYEFVKENWRDRTKFFPNEYSPACKAYNVNCPFLGYCEFNQNDKMLPQED